MNLFTLLVWTKDYSQPKLIGFSFVPTFQVRLPFDNEELQLVVKIRDRYDCESEMNLSSIRTEKDFDQLHHLLTSNNQHLFNQNQLHQLIFSLAKQINLKFENSTLQHVKKPQKSDKFFFSFLNRKMTLICENISSNSSENNLFLMSNRLNSKH